MKNSNIIISIIVVLCIGAGVTAYGLINPENNIFTNLPGFNPEDSTTGGDDQETGNGESGGSGSGSGGSGTNSGSGSGISASNAKNIANNHIAAEGCYAGTPKTLDNGNWLVPVIDANGNIVDGIEIDSKNGKVIGRA
ncbi:MAG: endoglucanase [Methanobrevibacter sp.]|nr:endoglucanase [Methanobrevibacter sp.]